MTVAALAFRRSSVAWLIIAGTVLTGFAAGQAGVWIAGCCGAETTVRLLVGEYASSIAYISFLIIVLSYLCVGDWRNTLSTLLKNLICNDLILVLSLLIFFLLVSVPLTSLWCKVLGQLGIVCSTGQPLRDLIADSPPGLKCLFFFLTVFLVPLGEELLFRLALFSAFRGVFSVPCSVCFTALIFGAAHFFLSGFPALTLLGVLAQWIFLRTGKLSAAWIFHALNNLAAFIAAV